MCSSSMFAHFNEKKKNGRRQRDVLFFFDIFSFVSFFFFEEWFSLQQCTMFKCCSCMYLTLNIYLLCCECVDTRARTDVDDDRKHEERDDEKKHLKRTKQGETV